MENTNTGIEREVAEIHDNFMNIRNLLSATGRTVRNQYRLEVAVQTEIIRLEKFLTEIIEKACGSKSRDEIRQMIEELIGEMKHE